MDETAWVEGHPDTSHAVGVGLADTFTGRLLDVVPDRTARAVASWLAVVSTTIRSVDGGPLTATAAVAVGFSGGSVGLRQIVRVKNLHELLGRLHQSLSNSLQTHGYVSEPRGPHPIQAGTHQPQR